MRLPQSRDQPRVPAARSAAAAARSGGGEARRGHLKAELASLGGAAPGAATNDLLLCLNRLAVSIIFSFVSLPSTAILGNSKKGARLFGGVFFPSSPLSSGLTLSPLRDSATPARFGEGARAAGPAGSRRPGLGAALPPPVSAALGSPPLRSPPSRLIGRDRGCLAPGGCPSPPPPAPCAPRRSGADSARVCFSWLQGPAQGL